MGRVKTIVLLILIFIQTLFYSTTLAEEKTKESGNALSKATESFAAELKPILRSLYIVIDDNKNIYLHDSSTFVGLMFDGSKRVSFGQMNDRVKEFAIKGNELNLHSVFLVVEEKVPFKYLYEVIRCYEEAVYNNTGSNIVEYRFSSPLTPAIIKARIEENRKYPIRSDHGN
jgi:hypothetical protein